MIRSNSKRLKAMLIIGATVLSLGAGMARAAPLEIANTPLFLDGAVAEGIPPMNMLVMGRDHKMYYEAYNDASDLDGDGVLDVGYRPESRDGLAGIDYYGYFDSYKCYSYSSGVFAPSSTTTDKKCGSAWSGDFLNYLTTSRIDALRKVLYGGTRYVDDDDRTVLARSYIPQEAHSWGKEYKSVEHDGYDIGDYSPLDAPLEGTRHLFANTTLLYSGDGEPLLRVLTDSSYRIWEWVSIEQPVAGDRCIGGDCETGGGTVRQGHPNSASEFQTMVNEWAIPSQLQGSDTITTVHTTGSNNNPFQANPDDYYMTIIRGEIYFPRSGNTTYEFAIDGDDAVEVLVDGQVLAGWYGGHGTCGGCKTYSGTIVRPRGWYPIEIRHEEQAGGDSYQLFARRASNGGNQNWYTVQSSMDNGMQIRTVSGSSGSLNRSFYSLERTLPGSVMTDYTVRVEACVDGLLDPNCKLYPDGRYKPTGLLHDYGESDRMLFGLLTGSYLKNLAGGVLRKPMGSFTDEVDATTGQFTDVEGIVHMIDEMRVVDFGKGTYYYHGHLVNNPLTAAPQNFPDWGNPVGEMMYESLRYFLGKNAPTPDFLPTLTGGKERVTLRHDIDGRTNMDLPVVTEWEDPYEGRPWCSKGAQLVISDVNPSYDTDQIPGSAFPSSVTGDVAGLDVAAQANAIWNEEHGGGSAQHFIGQVAGGVVDNAPTEKAVPGLGSVRGISPEEPSKQGGYYSAGVARYAYVGPDGTFDIRDDLFGDQNIQTFSVALASPLPKIDVPIGDDVVTVVPFAKSVGGFGISADRTAFQPTNTIVDFYIETFANTDEDGSDADPSINDGRPFIKFRINYEDVEQGADHDMDAIIVYELIVNEDDTLTINLESEYAAGSIIHHLGYVISGTTQDGMYLEVRDRDTGAGSDPAYYLDTPAGLLPGACAVGSPPAACSDPLPLTATRTFTSDSSPAATLLENPLWYAAKYGSKQPTDIGPGDDAETYFLVTNASTLSAQLAKAFKQILALAEDSTATVSESPELRDGSLIFRSTFNSDDWTGDVLAYEFLPADEGEEPEAELKWKASENLPGPGDRNVWTWDPYADTPDKVLFSTETLDDDGFSDQFKQALVSSVSFIGSDLFPDLTDPNPAGADYRTALERVILYLLGDDEHEADESLAEGEVAEPGTFRYRSTKIGDIIGSQPVVDSSQVFDWFKVLPEDSYKEFVEGEKESRSPNRTLYIGSNDGMLHAFDATETGGNELFAYIPSAVFGKLKDLVDPSYTHQFYVDATPVLVDALLPGATGWSTVLVGTAGAGGRGVYALNVSDPGNWPNGPDNGGGVLWDINTASGPAFADHLGYVIGKPLIYRMADESWAAIFGNGYNSESHEASLYIVRFPSSSADEPEVTRIDTGVGDIDTPNGLSTPRVIRGMDDQGQPFAAFAYAGDLHGNLWKFDLRDPDADNWEIVNDEPMFVATDPDGEPQPIFVQPDIVVNPQGGRVVFFGTGKYFEYTDPSDQQVQTFYAVRDFQAVSPDLSGSAEDTLGRGDLLERTISSVINAGDTEVRKVAGDPMNWGTSTGYDGWYLDLVSSDGINGERVVQSPQVLLGLLFFTSYEPAEDPCTGGGLNRTYVLDALDGKARINLTKVDPASDLAELADDCGAGSAGCASILASQGAPISPPVVIVDKMCDGVKCGREIQLLVDVRDGGGSDGGSDGGGGTTLSTVETLTVREVIDGRVFWRRSDEAVFAE